MALVAVEFGADLPCWLHVASSVLCGGEERQKEVQHFVCHGGDPVFCTEIYLPSTNCARNRPYEVAQRSQLNSALLKAQNAPRLSNKMSRFEPEKLIFLNENKVFYLLHLLAINT